MPKMTSSHDRLKGRYEKLVTTIERWQRKLDRADRTVTRAVKTLAKLERQRRRLQLKLAAAPAANLFEPPPKPEPVAQVEPPPSVTLDQLGETDIGKANAESWNAIPAVKRAREKAAADDDIPPFLQRDKQKDEAAAEAVKAELAAKKRTKAKAAAEKKKAARAGDTKRMPLTGREAFRYAMGRVLSGKAESE